MEGKEKCSRRRKRTSLAAGTLLIVIALFIAVTSVVAQPVDVRVTPELEYVEEGATFVATIDVDSVTDLNAAQFDLSFDKSVVKVSEVKEGEINEEEFPIVKWRLNPDKDAVRVIASLKIGESVDGSGYLAEIEFEVKGDEGEKIELTFSNGELVDATAKIVPSHWINATITIGVEGEGEVDEGEEGEDEEDEEPTPTPTLEPGVTPTPTPEANVTVTPSPTPSLAPGETPAPTPTLAPGETAKPTTKPALPKPTAKPTAPPTGEEKPTPEAEEPGFEAVFAIAVILGIAYILLRRKR